MKSGDFFLLALYEVLYYLSIYLMTFDMELPLKVKSRSHIFNGLFLMNGVSYDQSLYETHTTRLLGRPQPQMYPPVTLNQYTLVNRTHKYFIYML